MQVIEANPPRCSTAKNGHAASPEPIPAKLRLQGIHVSFASRQGRVQALQDVDLSIYPGEFVCLVGPSGCGKSTLLNILAGLIRPDMGSAFKDGAPITAPGPDRAVIFQDAALFPWLTAVQNVEFALKHVRDKRERRNRAMDHLQMVHLGRFASSYPHELSGGMRQREAIARAMALDPDVLLMDEPFAALDAQTRDLLIEEVQRIWLATRKTVVFVTHNVLEAVTLADRVVCMGARPGCVKLEIPVALVRPREVESPDTARIARTILDSLQDEIAKIAQEESDYAEDRARNGDANAGRILHPTSGTMGDGI
jgi:NitT/TauT family transport system ATP-binding protein